MRTESTSGGSAPSVPRTLAEELRGRDDASLAALLRARPDLLSPVPGDLTQLATRAVTRASVVRAVERLDTFALQTAEALAVAPDPAPYETLKALLTGDDGAEAEAESRAGAEAEAGSRAKAESRAEAGSGSGSGSRSRSDTPEDTTPDAITPTHAAVETTLPAALAALREQALVWGPDDRLRLVRTARDLLAPSPQHPSPTGLGPTVAEVASGMSPGRLQQLLTAAGLPTTHDPVSAVDALRELFTDRTRMAALLDEAPAEAVRVLSRLTWGPPYGQVTADPAPPVRWLLDRGLLLPTAPGTVVLPREVALHLRGGRAHRELRPLPPEVPAAAEHRPRVVDAAAASQAYTALATVEELLREWHEGGPAVLRAGGLSVRDLKRTAVALDVSEPIAAFWVELSYAAGLLASDGEADERYAATPAYDDWLELSAPDRWAALATAWLAATRTAGLVGSRDGKDRTLSALGPHLDRSAAPEVRRRVLDLLAELPEGGAPDLEAVLARLRWERPLRGGSRAGTGEGDGDLRSQLAQWALSEAELLGVTGRGALSTHGRALLDATSDATAADAATATATAHRTTDAVDAATADTANAHSATPASALAPLLPEPLDHVLLQADLTAVAPGPLRRPLAETLSVLADVESKGGATVYRFTPGSVRRALDAGRSASDLHDFLVRHSRTPVPQPLTYLIDDVARRHGHLRIGAASAYVRCDDDALLNEILADKRASALRLRRLAPTVLAAQADPGTLLEGLRAMGFAPAAESPEGDVVITRAHAHRTPPRTAPAPVPEGPPAPDDVLLEAALRALRAGDAASRAGSEAVSEGAAAPQTLPDGELPRTTPAETLATVQTAVLTGGRLWIGYVNAEGAASRRVIAPVRVEGGFVTAYDHTADEIRTYPLHRVTGAVELAD
ncbi:helicase-associated domain-containing protein [Streptomyces sp. NPDC002851]